MNPLVQGVWCVALAFALAQETGATVDMIARPPTLVMGTVPADSEHGYPGLAYQYAVDDQSRLVAFLVRVDTGKAIDILSLNGAESLKSRSIDSANVSFAWTLNRPGGKIPGEDLLILIRFRPYQSCGSGSSRTTHIFRVEEGELTETTRCG